MSRKISSKRNNALPNRMNRLTDRKMFTMYIFELFSGHSSAARHSHIEGRVGVVRGVHQPESHSEVHDVACSPVEIRIITPKTPTETQYDNYSPRKHIA